MRDLQLPLVWCVGALILILILTSLVLVCSVLPTSLHRVATYFGGPFDCLVAEARCGWHAWGFRKLLRVPYNAFSALLGWVLALRLGLCFGGNESVLASRSHVGCPLFVSKIAELRQLWSTLAQISNPENLKEGSIQPRRLLEIEPVAVEIKAQNGPQPCLSQERRVFEDSYRQPNKLQSSKAHTANDIQRRLCNVVNKAIPCFDDAQ
ncbi:hypothetical protein FCULG_00002655 [Fusarium culmorum]|uniref:Uncharacterized protein n=1 Tax=Fusarium culmorum TaxID=5516 RepID=A0A2T4GJP9_FUSCU|nr:hypothetical protein FCULG_00002655 [Fusarium culmorum]